MSLLKVGITGGIGSGKSTICRFFTLLGIPVFEADREAKQLMNSSPNIRAKLQLLFGDSVYQDDGLLNKARLAELIFNDPNAIKKVNSIVHPEVRNYFNQWCKEQDSPYIILEAAILFESGFDHMVDYTIVVTAPQADRIQRVIQREGTTAEKVKERMNNQWTDEQRLAKASYNIITNDRKLVIPQLLELDKKFRTHE